MVKPIEFITQLRKSDSYIKDIYSNGGCYQFYKILNLLYPNAEAYKVKVTHSDTRYNHIITLINDIYYDIRGIVKVSDYYDLKCVSKEDIDELENWSFSKFNWLFKTCPNCDEEIIA